MTKAQDERHYDKFQRTMARFYAYGRMDEAMMGDSLDGINVVDRFVEFFLNSTTPSVRLAWIMYHATLVELQEAGYTSHT